MSGLRFILLSVFLLVGVAALANGPMTGKIVTIKERQMISLQDFAEIFDAVVDYHVDRDEIAISLFDTTVYLVPYRMTAWVNERKVWLDMPVVIVDDTTYLPVRFICDAFGLRYDWTPTRQEVIVINRWTTERIVLIIDLDWYRQPRVWRYDFDLRWYTYYRTPCYYVSHHYHSYQYYHHVVTTHGCTCPSHGGNKTYNIASPISKLPSYRSDSQQPRGANNPPTQGTVLHVGTGRPAGNSQRPEYDRPNGNFQRPDTDRPNWSYQRPDTDRPNGNFQRPDYDRPNGGYGSKTERPNSNNNDPSWKRDPRQVTQSVGAILNIEWLRKDRNGRPTLDSPHGGSNSPANRPQNGNQGNGQKVEPRDNGKPEKESKDQGRERDERERDNRDKGRKK